MNNGFKRLSVRTKTACDSTYKDILNIHLTGKFPINIKLKVVCFYSNR